MYRQHLNPRQQRMQRRWVLQRAFYIGYGLFMGLVLTGIVYEFHTWHVANVCIQKAEINQAAADPQCQLIGITSTGE